jgi:hypothetical protein
LAAAWQAKCANWAEGSAFFTAARVGLGVEQGLAAVQARDEGRLLGGHREPREPTPFVDTDRQHARGPTIMLLAGMPPGVAQGTHGRGVGGDDPIEHRVGAGEVVACGAHRQG